ERSGRRHECRARWNETRRAERNLVAPCLRPPTSSEGASTAPSEPPPGSVARAKPALEGRSVRRPPTECGGPAAPGTERNRVAPCLRPPTECGRPAAPGTERDRVAPCARPPTPWGRPEPPGT